MLLAIVVSLKYVCSKATALDLKAVSIVCAGIKGGERRDIMSKILRISRSVDILALILLI